MLVGKLPLATGSTPMRRALVADRRQGEAGETGAGLADRGLAGPGLAGSGLAGQGRAGSGLAGELRELLAAGWAA